MQPEWVDYNGHMNVAYYVLIFDHATDAFLECIGMNEAARIASRASVFVVEAHLTYEKEVMVGDALSVESRILDADSKRMHLFHQMTCPSNNPDQVVATNELMLLYVDMMTRRSADMPATILSTIKKLICNQNDLPTPIQVGSTIGIRRR